MFLKCLRLRVASTKPPSTAAAAMSAAPKKCFVRHKFRDIDRCHEYLHRSVFLLLKEFAKEPVIAFGIIDEHVGINEYLFHDRNPRVRAFSLSDRRSLVTTNLPRLFFGRNPKNSSPTGTLSARYGVTSAMGLPKRRTMSVVPSSRTAERYVASPSRKS